MTRQKGRNSSASASRINRAFFTTASAGENIRLALDFKISTGCNSGVFIRTFPLRARPGKDVGFNGLEVAVDDTATAGYHDTGAIYDLSKPSQNAMKPAGQWNHMTITCDRNLIEVELNGQKVNRLDLDQWTAQFKF